METLVVLVSGIIVGMLARYAVYALQRRKRRRQLKRQLVGEWVRRRKREAFEETFRPTNGKVKLTKADAQSSYTHSRPRPDTDPPNKKPK